MCPGPGASSSRMEVSWSWSRVDLGAATSCSFDVEVSLLMILMSRGYYHHQQRESERNESYRCREFREHRYPAWLGQDKLSPENCPSTSLRPAKCSDDMTTMRLHIHEEVSQCLLTTHKNLLTSISIHRNEECIFSAHQSWCSDALRIVFLS